MAAELRWKDVQDIAIALADRYRDVAPLELPLTEVHRYVTALPEFADDPQSSDEAKLQTIQTAWHEEWEDRTR